MNDQTPFESASSTTQQSLATWLQQLFRSASEEGNSAIGDTDDTHLALLLHSDYHVAFYQQLPDFIMDLLTHGSQVAVSYAPLLYHLADCHECHKAYLDLYAALQATVQPLGSRTLLGQGTRTLSATPQRMLAHLCQSLISQAEAVLRHARHEHTDQNASARSLLQLALSVSAHIGQHTIRLQALQGLVHVATLFDGPTAPQNSDPTVLSYTPLFVSAGGLRRGKVQRRSDPSLRADNQEQPMIILQAQALEGNILQHGQTLELHLHDLSEALWGQHVAISVLLGSLIEPVRWLGGNPRAIRSISPVEVGGSLVTALGETSLQMGNPEDRNLLEAMFMLLEIRATT